MKKPVPLVCLADEITGRRNREAYDGMASRPRVLVDVSDADIRVKLLKFYSCAMIGRES